MARSFGGPGMPGGGNMQQLMKQAQKMQRQMVETQEALNAKEFEVTAGGGAIKIVVNGEKVLKSIEIDKEVIDPDDAEMLQDLILSAVNEAIRTATEAVNNEMSKLTGGMNLPGMF